MTYYQALKSLTEEQASALISGGLLGYLQARNIRLFEYYEELLKEMPKMDARTQTAERFCISEDRVSVIVRKMRTRGIE